MSPPQRHWDHPSGRMARARATYRHSRSQRPRIACWDRKRDWSVPWKSSSALVANVQGRPRALLVGNTWANPEARGAIHQHMASGDRMHGAAVLHPRLAEQPQISPPSAYFLRGQSTPRSVMRMKSNDTQKCLVPVIQQALQKS